LQATKLEKFPLKGGNITMTDKEKEDTSKESEVTMGEGTLIKVDRVSSDDPELSLEGMDIKEAKEYVLDYISTEKRVEQALSEKLAQVKQWVKRAELAKEKGRENLAREAGNRSARYKREANKLKRELASYRTKNAILKEKLLLKAKEIDSTKAEALLASLEALSGKSTEELKLDSKFEDQEIDTELDKLKSDIKAEE